MERKNFIVTVLFLVGNMFAPHKYLFYCLQV